MALDMAQPFVWGSGGRRLTPEEILAERKAASSLGQEAMSTAPVGHWSAGLNRVLQGLMAGYDSYSADQASKANATDSASLIASMLGGGATPATPTVAAAPVAAPASAPVAPNPTADAIRAGLIQRGLPANVADGFVMNMRDESGLNPGINEAAPIVPGSRGGFGLAQWTGPRRVGLENFAATTGRPVDGVDTQLDYLMSELKGPEAKAFQSIANTQTPNDAAVAIARDFLRPAPENLERRVAQYSGAPATSTSKPTVNPAIVQAMTSPYVSEQARNLAGMLFKSNLDQQAKAADPLRQLQIKKAQSEVAPVEAPYKDADGNLVQKDAFGKVTVLAAADKAPTSVSEYKYYRDNFQPSDTQQRPMDYATWSTAKARAAATNITNNVGDQETSFQKEAGKVQAQRFNDLVAEGQQAKQLMSDVSTLTDLGQKIGTGKAAEFKASVGPYAEALGVPVKGLSDIQAYEAVVNRVAPTLRVKGSGAQSDMELKNFLKSLPSLGNTPEGNSIAATVMQGLQQNKVLASEIASKAINGEITRGEADKQLRNLPDPMQPYRDFTKGRFEAPAGQPNKSAIEAEMRRRGLL